MIHVNPIHIDALNFKLPHELEASEPPEARGLVRDEVRLMVSNIHDDTVTHGQFRDIVDALHPGDVVVINTSGTLNAALPARRADGKAFELHLSTRLPAGLWVVEMRELHDDKHSPFYDVVTGETYTLPAGGEVTLLTPHSPHAAKHRLWIARLSLPDDWQAYLQKYGYPIRYSYVKQGWSNAYYQTVYATELGSAEMPSAGRAFTAELITRLVAKGVQIVPILLHTGVASLEDHEPPYEEYYRVSPAAARLITEARRAGQRIIAVGTTVVRALETVTQDSITHPGEGWTTLIITPERGIHAVNGMLTGLHEPQATHLAMLEALAGRDHLCVTYRAALEHGYLWHEFGDLHLILP
jgi:S-adenosylmethionine:tRNA ribosyltransferase-isomerase